MEKPKKKKLSRRARRYKHRIHCAKRLIRRYRRAARGKPLLDVANTFICYKRDENIETCLMPGRWGHVVAIALLYACAINVIKVSYYEAFGKPLWLTVSESEAIYSGEINQQEHPALYTDLESSALQAKKQLL